MTYFHLARFRLSLQSWMFGYASIVLLLPMIVFAQENTNTVAILYDPVMLLHDTGPGHPERPERLSTVVDYLKQLPLNQQLQWPVIKPASDETIELVHSSEYLKKVKQEIARIIPGTTKVLSTGDTVLSPKTLTAAKHAVGAVVQGVDMVMQGKVRTAFALVRPPGHHASRHTGMGFCVFNNVAIAAKHLQQQYGLKRILIVDFDVHHGNGTQAIFEADPSVYYFSVHQAPLYPGTGDADEVGTDEGEGFTMNVPLPPRSGDADVRKAFETQLVPAMQRFKPEFILVSAGIDSHAGDLLGRLNYSDQGYATLSSLILKIANRFSQNRVLFALEGGYQLNNLQRSIEHIIKSMLALELINQDPSH